MALARSQGGQAPRVRVGLDLQAIDLASGEGIRSVAAAVVEGVAKGKVTSAQAQAITGALRLALEVLRGDQEQSIRELEAKVAEVLEGRTVTVRR